MRKYREENGISAKIAGAEIGISGEAWRGWERDPYRSAQRIAPAREKILAQLRNWEKSGKAPPKVEKQKEQREESDLRTQCKDLVDKILDTESARAKAAQKLKKILGI